MAEKRSIDVYISVDILREVLSSQPIKRITVDKLINQYQERFEQHKNKSLIMLIFCYRIIRVAYEKGYYSFTSWKKMQESLTKHCEYKELSDGEKMQILF